MEYVELNMVKVEVYTQLNYFIPGQHTRIYLAFFPVQSRCLKFFQVWQKRTWLITYLARYEQVEQCTKGIKINSVERIVEVILNVWNVT